jgi:hypothetical protein
MSRKIKKKPSFVVYIDESGDEGFVFREDGSGSSRWFVLSAAVIRRSNDSQMVSCLKSVREVLHKEPKTALHFVDLKHEQRIPYVRRVGELPIRTVSVLIHKPSIQEPETFQSQKYRLYRYATRMLLERVSWLCRDQHKPEEGDGIAEIIFSNRSNMSYDDLREYLHRLKERETQIHWPVIDPDRIQSIEHSKRAGLQVADAVASGVHFAVKVNRYGETESGYLNHLSRTLYRYKDRMHGYGVKLWPGDLGKLKEKAPEVRNLEAL